jgi:basic amino acid/polyamine antiporter, APA family
MNASREFPVLQWPPLLKSKLQIQIGVGARLEANQADAPSGLVRVIGRWSLVALMINTMIGASIFGLPAVIAAYLGKWSPAGYFVAFAGISVIAACMAEVASQFQEAGGPYLYARAAFGRFVAIQNGWLLWLARVAAVAGVANLFIVYLGEFFPVVKTPVPRAGILAALIGFLAAVNYRGVASGNRVSNFFTVAKVLLLSFFIVTGFFSLLLHPNLRVTPQATAGTAADWFGALLLMVYAYGGFESALIASGEARNARKDIPAALFTAIGITTFLYLAVQVLVVYTIQNAGASETPVVDSARRFLAPLGVQIIAAGTLVSAYGYLSANMLHTPRIFFAMSQRQDFPASLGRVHPVFRTPHISIVIFAAAIFLFSVAGTFRWNAILSGVARLFVYGTVAAALPLLRKKQPQVDAFRLPFGSLFSLLGLVFSGALIARMHRGELIVISGTFALALFNWLWVRNRQDSSGVNE